MSKRSAAQVKGMMAEYEVCRELLRLGIGVNSLTADDTGWDIHVVLPKHPIFLADKGNEVWGMSASTCHIQVKYGRYASRLNMHTVSEWMEPWVSPTFLVLGDEGEDWKYVTPEDLDTWAQQFERGPKERSIHQRSYTSRTRRRITVEPARTRSLNFSNFGSVLHLWCNFPDLVRAGEIDPILAYLDVDITQKDHAHWLELVTRIAAYFSTDSAGFDKSNFLTLLEVLCVGDEAGRKRVADEIGKRPPGRLPRISGDVARSKKERLKSAVAALGGDPGGHPQIHVGRDVNYVPCEECRAWILLNN